MKPTTRAMSDAHEKFIAELIGGRICAGSGNQFANQCDVRNSHTDGNYAYAADGKSTLGKSIGVSLAMWGKLVEQAHDLTPLLPLRFYPSENLRNPLDLVVIKANNFSDLLFAARLAEGRSGGR